MSMVSSRRSWAGTGQPTNAATREVRGYIFLH
jgi:hypothetical protein